MVFNVLKEGFDAAVREFIGNDSHCHDLEAFLVFSGVELLLPCRCSLILSLFRFDAIFALDDLRFDKALGLLLDDFGSGLLGFTGLQNHPLVALDVPCGQVLLDADVPISEV